MLSEPTKITRGPRWLKDWLNSLRDFAVAIRPLPSDTIDISESPKGTRLDQISQDPGSSPTGSDEPLPWDIYSLVGIGVANPSTGKFATYTAKVYPALISNAMPTNMFEEFTGAYGTGIYYLIATATTDGRGVISATLGLSATTAPTPPAPLLGIAATQVKVVVGVIVEGVPFNVWGRNINVQSREVLREDKEEVGPFELPYQSWWGWSVS